MPRHPLRVAFAFLDALKSRAWPSSLQADFLAHTLCGHWSFTIITLTEVAILRFDERAKMSRGASQHVLSWTTSYTESHIFIRLGELGPEQRKYIREQVFSHVGIVILRLINGHIYWKGRTLAG